MAVVDTFAPVDGTADPVGGNADPVGGNADPVGGAVDLGWFLVMRSPGRPVVIV